MTPPRRDVALLVHRTLAFVGCAVAFFAWSQPSLVEYDDGVTIVDGHVRDLRQLSWATPQGLLEVTLAKDGGASQVLFTPQPGRLDEAADGGPAPQPTANVQLRYPANAQALALAERLVHLRAIRRLGILSRTQEQALDLWPPHTTLVLDFAEQGLRRLRIGRGAHGSGELVAQDEEGVAYVLRPGTFAILRGDGSALQDRELVGLGRADVASLTIAQGPGATPRRYDQHFAKERYRAYLADPSAPKQPVPQAMALLEALLRLQVSPGTDAGASFTQPYLITLASEQSTTVQLTLSCQPAALLATSSRLAGAAALPSPEVCAIAAELVALPPLTAPVRPPLKGQPTSSAP